MHFLPSKRQLHLLLLPHVCYMCISVRDNNLFLKANVSFLGPYPSWTCSLIKRKLDSVISISADDFQKYLGVSNSLTLGDFQPSLMSLFNVLTLVQNSHWSWYQCWGINQEGSSRTLRLQTVVGIGSELNAAETIWKIQYYVGYPTYHSRDFLTGTKPHLWLSHHLSELTFAFFKPWFKTLTATSLHID